MFRAIFTLAIACVVAPGRPIRAQEARTLGEPAHADVGANAAARWPQFRGPDARGVASARTCRIVGQLRKTSLGKLMFQGEDGHHRLTGESPVSDDRDQRWDDGRAEEGTLLWRRAQEAGRYASMDGAMSCLGHRRCSVEKSRSRREA